MVALYQTVKISGLHKIANPEVLSQFVRAHNAIAAGEGMAPVLLAQAIRNGLKEANK